MKLYKICLDIDYSRCQIPPEFINKGGSEVAETEDSGIAKERKSGG